MLTAVKNHLRVILLSIKYNIIRQMVNKKSFLFSVFLMFASNASFLVQWIVIFSISKDSELTMKYILLIWGICSSSVGLSNILFGGVHFLPKYIEEGKLDAYLVQPKNTLLQVATSYSSVSAIGDIIYGLVVVLLASFKIKTFILFVLFSFLGSCIYCAYHVIIFSLIFYSLNFKEVTWTLARLPVSFGTYPDTIFSTGIKFFLFVILPLGAMVYFPVKVIINGNILFVLAIILYSIFIVTLAFIMFYNGLKRYTSSNLMSSRS